MATLQPKRNSVKARFTNFSRRVIHNEKPPNLSPEMQRRSDASRGIVSPEHTNGSAPAPNVPIGDTAPLTTPPASSVLETPSTDSSGSSYQIRAPAHHRRLSSLQASSPGFSLPDLPWLCGTWHVTHSTLPMWRNKRNVRITYTRLSGDKLDDLVTYQSNDSTSLQRVAGVDTPKSDGSYVWRGKGLLKVATSRWEVLGWGGGGRHVGTDLQASGDDAEQWVVTYFAKTLFTPAGIDIYSRSSVGLSEHTLSKVMKALRKVNTGNKGGEKTDFSKLVEQLFPVTVDSSRAVKGK